MLSTLIGFQRNQYKPDWFRRKPVETRLVSIGNQSGRKLVTNAHCSAPRDAADGLTPATYVAGDRISSALHACDIGSSPAFNTPSSPRLLTEVEGTMSSSNEVECGWKIVHIPDKPPVLPHLQPTVNVYAAEIEPKDANTLVRKLNQICPLENLRHVKRIRKKCIDGGKPQLSLILSMTNEDAGGMPSNVLELVKSYQLSTFITKVCRYAASTKEEWEEQCKLWPTSFHPPTYNISGITGFSEEESQSVFSFMKSAINLAKSIDGLVINAAIIVDPSTKQVIASACDEVVSLNSSRNEAKEGISCSSQREASSHTRATDMADQPKLLSDDSSNKPIAVYDNISCLHPWKWAEQQFSASFSSWHPLRHAAIVAIDHSATRDRELFPSAGYNGYHLAQEDCVLSPLVGSPSKRQKVNLTEGHGQHTTLLKNRMKEYCIHGLRELGEDDNKLKQWITKFLEGQDKTPKVDTPTSSKTEQVKDMENQTVNPSDESSRPYLCTGYDIYLVWEPCSMCAMALVHQRVRRIFYAFPNLNAGALGSVHRLQGERSLNHHYAVFRVLLPKDILRPKVLDAGTTLNDETIVQVSC
nr:probable inactive tRNA-specific adenosine deaminase-like protein 3 isoform X1 [Ipomoea batatas]